MAGLVAGFDDGAGSITGTGIASGTVDYVTGCVSVTFTAAPASGTPVLASIVGQVTAAPEFPASSAPSLLLLIVLLLPALLAMNKKFRRTY
jgi:hypothetical protein